MGIFPKRSLAKARSRRYGSLPLRLSRLALLLILLLAPAATAREVHVPFSVPPKLIRDALMEKVFKDEGGRAQFWGHPGECSFFYLEDPKIDGTDGRLRITAHGEARLGTEFLGSCFSPLVWSGYLEMIEEPRIEDWILHFRVSDSNIFDEKHEKTLLAGKLWDRIKGEVQPRFEAISVNLGDVLRELRAFLPTVTPSDKAEEVQQALDSLHPVSVEATLGGLVTITAAMALAEAAPAAAPAGPEAPLTEAEIEAFTARLDQWDGFLTFVIKELGRNSLRPIVRDALLETLLEARYEILDSLDQPARGQDPVRRLFVETWQRLWPLAEEIGGELPGGGAIRVVSFIAAGDALAVLDQAGPSFGIEISADGLRRLARLIQPEVAGDPLERTDFIDPALRLTFGFGSALDLEAAPETGWWWEPGRAWAAEVNRSAQWKGWLFRGPDGVMDYLTRVGKLLRGTSSQIAGKEKLDGAEDDLYRKLVPATAWQESCWRQFLVHDGAVTYLRSAQGSVGMLQVNERVWRGFYDVDRLRWKIEYNTRAGADILLRYLQLSLEKQGDITAEAVPPRARAIYALYNGGPGQYRRYLDSASRGKTLTRVIDQLFGEKFDSVSDGVEGKVARCLIGGS